jgi:D-serine deaminase-like pyridoxal phosphate-dependent protein
MITFKQLTTPAALMDVAQLQRDSDGMQSRMSKPSSRPGFDGR